MNSVEACTSSSIKPRELGEGYINRLAAVRDSIADQQGRITSLSYRMTGPIYVDPSPPVAPEEDSLAGKLNFLLADIEGLLSETSIYISNLEEF